MLTPPLYGAPERLQDGRAEIADGEGVAQARVDGEDQRQPVKPGGRGPDRKDGKVLAEVHVHHIGPCGNDRSDDCRLGTVELAKAPYGESQTYNAGVVAQALQTWRGRRACGQHRLDDAAPVERPGKLCGVVLHPPDRIELDALAGERRGGGSNTEQSLSTLSLFAKSGLGFVLLPASMAHLPARSPKLTDQHPTPPP